MAEMNRSIQLIDGKGCFNDSELKNFTKSMKLDDCGPNYVIISIMGPQSSGKSTLLNELFQTKFEVMDASKRKSQTTKGIWLAKYSASERCTLVMDVEGTDGRERGENDTTFERQSALFALAISDIVLINMWYTDLGRENAANKPLLRTVFQVMTDLFILEKKTLMFVIRDSSPKATLETLKADLLKDINEVWDKVKKSQNYEKKPLSDVFDVKIEVLPHFEWEKEKFKQQVKGLREKLFHSIVDDNHAIPGSGIATYLETIWQRVKDNKNLDFPSYPNLVADKRCEEIVKESLDLFTKDKDWLQLKKDVQSIEVPNIKEKLTSFLQKSIKQ